MTDNNWSIAIVISQDTAKELADASSVKVQFPDTSEVFYATVELKSDGNTNIAILSFDNSMVQYATSRYADIELITTDESGLKIPESSVTEKTFYTVPVDYITQGGNSNSTGVLVDNGADTAKFVSANIYYSDSESNMVYLSTDVIDKNATLKKQTLQTPIPYRIRLALRGSIILTRVMQSSNQLQFYAKVMDIIL